MESPDPERLKYMKDSRMACKYGVKCYQKSSAHHNKYKHPPKRGLKNEDKSPNPPLKMAKLEELDGGNQKKQIKNSFTSEEDRPKQETVTKSTDKEDETIPNNTEDEIIHNNTEDKCKVELSTLVDKKMFIKTRFLFEMPEDFYAFWEFCKSYNSKNPLHAFKDIGLILVGPFDVLADKFSNISEKSPVEYLIHWRYNHDPPEFQTVIKGDDSTGFHIGYFRDDPQDLPVFLASNQAKIDGEVTPIGENIFAAINNHLESLIKSGNPFMKMNISKLQSALKKEAERLNLSLSTKTQKMQERDKKIVTRTFNKAGLVVPIDRKTQVGYRPLVVSNKELRILLTRLTKASPEQKDKVLSELQPVITFASIATDECDFGTGIELGLNILSFNIDSLNDTAKRFLSTSYRLLQRDAFAQIAEAHLGNRKKGTDLSIL